MLILHLDDETYASDLRLISLVEQSRMQMLEPRTMLEDLGHKVLVCDYGEVFLSTLERMRDHIDAVILDVAVGANPHTEIEDQLWGGLEVYLKIKELISSGVLGDQLIVRFLTRYRPNEVRTAARSLGFSREEANALVIARKPPVMTLSFIMNLLTNPYHS
jgi:CheY-like chemotaxis protein